MNKLLKNWQMLKLPFKFLIIILPLALIGYLLYGKLSKDKINEATSVNLTNRASQALPDSTKSVRVDTENRFFNYTPEEPQEGILKGIVEVGATGFNSFIINCDKESRWKIVSKEFGKSFVYEGLASSEDIRQGLKKYIIDINEKGVQSKNVHFIISSGAQKEPKTSIISEELKKMGYVVNLVSPEQEAKYALKCLLPKAYYENSFVVDIGSGNTKVSYMSEGTEIKTIELEGSKYYEKGNSDEDVKKSILTAMEAIPQKNTKVCFIIGGVPYELANTHRNGEERYTVLKDPNMYKVGDKKKTICGLLIFKTIKEATNCDTFVFDWDANFSIGFLLSLN